MEGNAVATKRKNVKAQALTPDLLEKLAQGLKSVKKDAIRIYKRSERSPLISIMAPAYGRLSMHAINLTAQCCTHRNLGTKTPGAFRIQSNDALPDLIVLEPVVLYDESQSDQYELKWLKGNTNATINLRHLLQPRNMETPKGFVNEMPVSLAQLPGNNWVLILHTADAELRPVDSSDLEAETAAAEQE
jgi:hypothetical protein